MNGGGIAAMAVKPGRIARGAQNSMRGSGSRLSSPCEALRRVFEGVEMAARKRRVASDDADLVVVDGVTISRRGREKPNAFRAQHGPARALDQYFARGSITQRQFAAGDRLHCDLYAAGCGPRMTADLFSSGGGEGSAFGMPSTMAQVGARQRVRNARIAVGRRPWALLEAVIWDEMSAAAWAQGEGAGGDRHARSAGLFALQMALDTLADHYGIPDLR